MPLVAEVVNTFVTSTVQFETLDEFRYGSHQQSFI